MWGAVWREVTETTRAAAAELLGCRPDDLAITHNTTEGFNILAHGLDLGPGDEVLFSSLNHAGAAVPWNELAPRRGFSVRRFDFPLGDVAELTVDEVVRRHAEAVRPATRVLVIPHVDNMVGMTHPVRAIAEAARSRGVRYVFVDGAQSAGMIGLDLDALAVDAYAMSPHKWLQAPKGLGLLWTTPALRDAVPRMWHKTGGGGLDGSGRKYEDYSTRAWPAVVALGDALDFQGAIGQPEKDRRYARLRLRIQERVSSDPRLVWRSPRAPELGSMIVAVGVRGAEAPGVAPAPSPAGGCGDARLRRGAERATRLAEPRHRRRRSGPGAGRRRRGRRVNGPAGVSSRRSGVRPRRHSCPRVTHEMQRTTCCLTLSCPPYAALARAVPRVGDGFSEGGCGA